MSTITAPVDGPATRVRVTAPALPRMLTTLATLARRRLALSVRTPRELINPILTPVLFALVIAPALEDTFGATINGVDYMTFVTVATIGLLVPLSSVTSGLGVVVDRMAGARADLLAAPIPRSLIVVGNLLVALLLAGFQLVVLLVAATARGAEFDVSASGIAWFTAAAVGFGVFMYGIAEILANVLPNQEEYVGALPGVAIVPWFFAGSLFPISALPVGLAAFAKVLPITHALALMRHGVAGDGGAALHDIWGMDSTTTMAALSVGVVAVSALALTALSIRVFGRKAIS